MPLLLSLLLFCFFGGGGAIQAAHSLLPPSPPALNLSQHQGLFQWVGSSDQVAKVSGASALASILPMNIQGWFPLGLTALISLLFKGLWRVLQHRISTASILPHSAFFKVQLSHLYMTTIALSRQTFVSKVMSLLFNTLSRFVIAFLPRSKCLLISWLQSPSTKILEPKNTKSVTASTFSLSICHEVSDGTRCHDLGFLNVEF